MKAAKLTRTEHSARICGTPADKDGRTLLVIPGAVAALWPGPLFSDNTRGTAVLLATGTLIEVEESMSDVAGRLEWE